MGLRLLMPRYHVDVLIEQLWQMGRTKVDVGPVKVLPQHCWKMLLRFDYHRCHTEPPAPVALIDVEEGYKFPFPMALCPIDGLVEEFLSERDSLQARQVLHNSDEFVNVLAGKLAGAIFHIRGGGPG